MYMIKMSYFGQHFGHDINFNHFPLNCISFVVYDTEQLMHRDRSTIRLTYRLLVPEYSINMLWLKL